MLEGVNDGDAEARALARLAQRVSCKFNLIPFNPFPASGFKRSAPERIRRFAEILQHKGAIVTIRLPRR
jgi:23S rRNA (adenine2503-C2)-methyltransferase